ncbi:MAG: VOC family protein [Candidatus Nanosalina sp.]
MADQEGEQGAGMITELGLRVPKDSLEYWKKRLEDEEIEYETEDWHGRETLSFEDPHGLPLRIVPEDTEDYTPWEASEVPEENQIRGMHHVTVELRDTGTLGEVMKRLGMEETQDYGGRYFEMEDGSGIELRETEKSGRMGTGTVHHFAFKAADSEEELESMREKLQSIGLRPSPAINRKYFTSTYCRMPGGVLFEFSTMGPGYTADESVEELGTNFVLPEKLQDRRQEILEALPEFREEELYR